MAHSRLPRTLVGLAHAHGHEKAPSTLRFVVALLDGYSTLEPLTIGLEPLLGPAHKPRSIWGGVKVPAI